jgi:hypothetical protein
LNRLKTILLNRPLSKNKSCGDKSLPHFFVV